MTISPITAVIARWYCTGIHITEPPWRFIRLPSSSYVCTLVWNRRILGEQEKGQRSGVSLVTKAVRNADRPFPTCSQGRRREITMTISPITAVIARWYCTGIHITEPPWRFIRLPSSSYACTLVWNRRILDEQEKGQRSGVSFVTKAVRNAGRPFPICPQGRTVLLENCEVLHWHSYNRIAMTIHPTTVVIATANVMKQEAIQKLPMTIDARVALHLC